MKINIVGSKIGKVPKPEVIPLAVIKRLTKRNPKLFTMVGIADAWEEEKQEKRIKRLLKS